MSIKKVPFVNYNVGEKVDPFDSGKIITVRLSAQEYKSLMVMAKSLHISRESTLLKELAFIGINVINTIFGLDFLKWLTDGKRLTDDVKLDNLIVEKKENVLQK